MSLWVVGLDSYFDSVGWVGGRKKNVRTRERRDVLWQQLPLPTHRTKAEQSQRAVLGVRVWRPLGYPGVHSLCVCSSFAHSSCEGGLLALSEVAGHEMNNEVMPYI